MEIDVQYYNAYEDNLQREVLKMAQVQKYVFR